MASTLPRLIEPLLDRLLQEIPAVMLTGPRAVGKTTLASVRAASTARLDTQADAAAASLDPDAFLKRLTEPILIDEWQNVPSILPAVKRAVDDDPRGGRFILTGSVDAETDPGRWAGTGRILDVALWGMSVAEREGRGDTSTFLDRLLDGATSADDYEGSTLAAREYVEIAMQSGFPTAALRLSGLARQAWLSSYIDQLVVRDVAELGPRNPALLRRYVEALALNSAGVVTLETLLSAAGINRRTAAAYDGDLQRVYLLDLVEPWFTHRLSRLVKLPKRYLTDAALLPAALGLGVDEVVGDPDLVGRVLDTFVCAQLRAQLGTRVPTPRLHHLRDQDGSHEVDIILEHAGRLYGFEIKSTAAPSARDARHLRWLADRVGDTFRLGVVFSSNPHPIDLGDRVIGLPISALWG